MKRKLLLLGCIIGAALFTEDLNAQINYSEDFEGTINWSGTDFFQSNDLPCEGSNSFVCDIHGGFVTDASDVTVSPSLGTSNGNPVTLVYNYRVYNYVTTQPAQNADDWGSITVSWGTSATGPWTALETINPANHTESANCAERTVNFTPANGSQVYIRVYTELNSTNQFLYIYIDDITATQEGCSTVEAPEANAAQTLCAGSTVAELEATGDEIIWYAGETGGSPLEETVVLTDGSIYYAAQVAGGCESAERTAVTVDLTVADAPQQLLIEQMFCQGDTVGEIQVGAQGEVLWYESETSEIPLDNNTLINSNVYYAAQMVNGCESQRADVHITFTVTPAPTGDATQEFIDDPMELFIMPYSAIEIETAEGATITWYTSEEDAENGENGLTEDDFFTESGTYYVTQTLNGCESDPFAVTVDIVMDADDFVAGNLKAYPNPVKDILTISYNDNITYVTLYNIVGQQVLSINVDSDNVLVNMSQLPTGTYMAKIGTANAVKTMKIIKQ